jgi:hypothetical protein
MDYFSARNAVAVTTHDTNPLTSIPTALWVGGAGNIAMRLMDDSADVIFTGVPAGTTLYVRPRYIRATSTTATAILALI